MDAKREGLSLGKAALVVYASLLVFTIVLMVLSIPAGLYTVYSTHISNTSLSSASPINNLGLFVGIYTVSVPVATSFGSLFTVLTAVYAALLAFAGFQHRNALSAIRSALAQGSSELFGNSLLASIIALGALTLGIGLLEIIQAGAGIKTGSISGDPLLLFLSITLAPLREELGFRVALVGFLALVLGFRSSVKTGLKALWRPSAILTGAPGDLPNKVGLSIMVGISSILFGAAHYFSGAGWDVGKVSEATAAGVVLGYLYVRYGFHAAVLLHWGVNYFGSAFAFFGQGVWGIPWDSNFGNPLSVLVELDLFILIGVTSFFLVGYKILKRLARARGAIESDSGGSLNPQGPGAQVQGDQPRGGRELRRGRLRPHRERRQDAELPRAPERRL
ncbi:MAG: CPBP family intramembrane metalloprotease [Thaumarchaeota archaeon]|nr:MAG: CPBP family intramembrane metalloprotease [Nitrososphaerota archaeon]